jgi:signal peptidase II
MKMTTPKLVVYIIAMNIVADQLIKFVIYTLGNNQGVVVPGFITIHPVLNPGISFSIFLPKLTLLIGIPIIIGYIIWLLVQSLKIKPFISSFGYAQIVAGAISNYIDRLRLGGVIDYIDVRYFTVFNYADVMITLGVGLLLFHEVHGHTKKDRATDVERS